MCPGPVVTGLLENSGSNRPARFGGPTQLEVAGIEDLDEAEATNLASLYMPASRAAEIALHGVKAGAFVIPTHPFEKDDVDARYREIAAGFDLLG